MNIYILSHNYEAQVKGHNQNFDLQVQKSPFLFYILIMLTSGLPSVHVSQLLPLNVFYELVGEKQ